MIRDGYSLLSGALILHIYVRSLYLAPDGITINPGVSLLAGPIALLMYLWTWSARATIPRARQTRAVSERALIHTRSRLAISLVFLVVGLICSAVAAEQLTLIKSVEALQLSLIGVLSEGIGGVGLWSAWTWRQVALGRCSESRAHSLHFPLSIALFALPWEGVLRGFDEALQRLSTDIAAYTLDLCDALGLCVVKVRYWDLSTLYSDQFYLIINETCAGVNLILSMSLYALGFGWVMRTSLRQAWVLVAYIIPLSIVFNGFRVAVIFLLGHLGSVELATGGWHEGTGYLSQLALFIVLALINYQTDASRNT